MQAIQTAASIMQELGLLAFLILVLALAFCWMTYRIVRTQDRIALLQDRLLEKMGEHDSRGALIQQKAGLMHDTCLDHGDLLDEMKNGMNDFRAKLLDRIAALEKEVALLKAKIDAR